MKKLFLFIFLLPFFLSFTLEDTGLYSSGKIINKTELSYEAKQLNKNEALVLEIELKNTSDLKKIEVISWEIYRRGYEKLLTNEVILYIRQQVDLKTIADQKIEGVFEDEIISNPFK